MGHNRFAYKNDRIKLSELAQFIREAFPQFRVEVEWAILYEEDGSWKVSQKVQYGQRYRTPDIMLFKGNRLVACIELDGSVHDTAAFGKTLKRNEWYHDHRISLIVINEGHMKYNMYDEAYRGIENLVRA